MKMGAKEYLLQVPKAHAIINGKLAEMKQWGDIATNISPYVHTVRIGGKEYGMERVQNSKDNYDSIGDAVAICVDMQDELVEAVEQYKEVIKEVSRTIEQLPQVEYEVVHGLYIQGKTLWEVADELDKSYSAVTTAHSRALQDLEEILES